MSRSQAAIKMEKQHMADQIAAIDTYTRTYMNTYIHTYIHTYTYI